MDSTFATQIDDVSSSLTVRAEALIRAAESVSCNETAPSKFLLALIPAQFKQLFVETPQPALVEAPLNEVPAGWFRLEASLAQVPVSPSNASGADAPHVFHNHNDSSGTSPRVQGQSSVPNEISLINFLAASSCLVTGEL
jgi:hypothetical protein